jgi:hypothetical protein
LEQSEDDDEDDLSFREVSSFNKFWGWFGTLVTLANEDITKIDEITQYPLIFVLNYLSYSKDLGDIRTRELQKQKMKYKV